MKNSTQLTATRKVRVHRDRPFNCPGCFGFKIWTIIIVVTIEIHRTKIGFILFFCRRSLNLQIQPFCCPLFSKIIQLHLEAALGTDLSRCFAVRITSDLPRLDLFSCIRFVTGSGVLLLGEILDIAFEVRSGEGAERTILGYFSGIFEEMFVFLMIYCRLLDGSFDYSDLRVREVVLVVRVFEF